MKTMLNIALFVSCLAIQSSADVWECIGPDGGDIVGSITNPANIDEVIAVTSNCFTTAVYHSMDGGKSWSKRATPPCDNHYIADFYPFDFSRLYLLNKSKCHFSKDSGVTWNLGDFTPLVNIVTSLCPHPTDPDTVYAAGIELYEDNVQFITSTDGGKTWTPDSLNFYFMPDCLAVAPSDPDTIYLGGTDFWAGSWDIGMIRSTDGGKTWTDISDNMDPDPLFGLDLIAIDPMDENIVYAVSIHRFYRTTDGGLSWTHEEKDHITAFAIDPFNRAILYLCTGDSLFKSINFGQNWTEYPNAIDGKASHIHVVPAAPSTVYVSAMTGGLFKTEDGGVTWSSAHQGIRALPVCDLAVAPSRPETLLVGLHRHSRLMASIDSGDSWDETTFPTIGINDCVVQLTFRSTNADVVMVYTDYHGNELYRSTDGGLTWQPSLDIDNGHGSFGEGCCLVEDPGRSNIFYAGGEHINRMIYHESKDAGATWSKRKDIGPAGGSGTTCDAFAVAPSNASFRYAGGSEGNYIKAWRKSGLVWEDITNELALAGGYRDYLNVFWVDPEDEKAVLAGTSVGLFISDDAGDSWNSTTITSKVAELAYHPLLDTVYAATATGVYRSEDRGNTWIDMSTGLSVLVVDDIAVDTKNGYLFAATDGASVWRYDLPASPLWVGADEISAAAGGTVELELNAGTENAGRNYLMLGGYSGTEPGTPLPGGQATLPLNWDLFTDLVISMINTHTFSDFMGQLDADGRATARINAPPIPQPGSIGVKLSFAYFLDHPFEYASNPVEVMILE